MGDYRMSIFIKIGADTYDADDYSIPTERTFREAWDTISGSSVISVNMNKARDIWRDKIRYARTEPLAALDTAYMKALETSADTTQIISDKQALRDAPSLPSIDEATTPEELVAIQPVPNVVIE
tara:strand:+ start:3480 stop:3851 length:372 start_codon:yes stop_codon:yes gene_type:complete